MDISRMRQDFQRRGPSPVEQALAVTEVYHALPTEALICTLRARGLDEAVELQRLERLYLVTLAVTTHRDWMTRAWLVNAVVEHDRQVAGPVMVDIPG
jgi:hypothetical protein